jgi:hypothetical protein
MQLAAERADGNHRVRMIVPVPPQSHIASNHADYYSGTQSDQYFRHLSREMSSQDSGVPIAMSSQIKAAGALHFLQLDRRLGASGPRPYVTGTLSTPSF